MTTTENSGIKSTITVTFLQRIEPEAYNRQGLVEEWGAVLPLSSFGELMTMTICEKAEGWPPFTHIVRYEAAHSAGYALAVVEES